jgi:hypothetical protein
MTISLSLILIEDERRPSELSMSTIKETHSQESDRPGNQVC